MPHKKISFQVVHASCEDELHPSAELNSDKHGPLVQGWISQKFCLYPIDLIIQFDRKIILKKVQILSHQYLIASKIEFYIGDCTLDEEVNYQNAKYTRLGYVELASNERTEFKARELKSVHVDAEGTFLKFVVHKNFVNKLNTYNQVGLIAINVIGTDLIDDVISIKNNEADPTILAAVKRPDYISPLDDLAFAMYQDPEISQIIRDLDKKKSDCVIAEKYDEAKRLKQAISELYKIGERLARYDIEKRQAIEEEDYEKAKLKKQQMQEYRAETYRQLQVNNLLDFIDNINNNNNKQTKAVKTLLKKSNQESLIDESSLPDINDNKNYKELPQDIKESETSDSPPPILSPKNSQYSTSNGNSKTRNKQISPLSNRQQPNELDYYGNKPSTPYDDRVIPTLRHTNTKSRMEKVERTDLANLNPSGSNILEEDQGLDQNPITEAIVPDQTEFLEQEMYDPIDGTEEMTESEVREAALMNDYLGKQIVTKLYSKNFQNREDAIQEVYTNLSNYKGEREEAKALMRAAAILVAKMSKDNVFSIFNNALKLIQFLLNDFAKRFSIGKQEVNYVLEKCLPVLVHRTGDTNARLRQRAHEYIVEMAMFPEIRPLHTIPQYCITPFKLHIAPRLALSRVEILEDLMKQLGYRDSGLTVDNISKFCSQALEHTSGEVRELATKILIQMYRENGQIVRRYLPPDNEMNRRNKKYRILYDAFDGIDGKPIQSFDRQLLSETSSTPRFNRTVRTPNKSKTPVRGTSLDRKTPNSIADESEYNPDNTCMFCGEVNEKFVKQGLEMHYWKSCPMLKQCNDCKQVIEVAVQTEHLLTECQHKSNYKKCQRCSEAVNMQSNQENEFHFKLKQCVPNAKGGGSGGGNRCPLCHTNLGSGEEVWKDHLMNLNGNGCTKNTRRNMNNNSVPDSRSNKAINQKK